MAGNERDRKIEAARARVVEAAVTWCKSLGSPGAIAYLEQTVADLEEAMNAPDKKCHKRRPVCSLDGCVGLYIEKYDAYACDACNRWLEIACGDPACVYCPSRPEKPFDV